MCNNVVCAVSQFEFEHEYPMFEFWYIETNGWLKEGIDFHKIQKLSTSKITRKYEGNKLQHCYDLVEIEGKKLVYKK